MKYFFTLTLSLWSLAGYTGAKFATYNLGLAHGFVPLAAERLPHLADALAASPADVLCLQEVWTKKDRRYVAEALQTLFPHQFSVPIQSLKSDKRPACLPWNLFGKGKFVSCMNANCKKLEGDEFTQCILNTCATAMDNLKQKKPPVCDGLDGPSGKVCDKIRAHRT